MEGGSPPGTIYRVPFDQCRHPAQLASLHGLDMSRVLFMAGNTRAPQVIMYGVEPARIEWGTELSPALQRTLPLACRAILDELQS